MIDLVLGRCYWVLGRRGSWQMVVAQQMLKNFGWQTDRFANYVVMSKVAQNILESVVLHEGNHVLGWK